MASEELMSPLPRKGEAEQSSPARPDWASSGSEHLPLAIEQVEVPLRVSEDRKGQARPMSSLSTHAEGFTPSTPGDDKLLAAEESIAGAEATTPATGVTPSDHTGTSPEMVAGATTPGSPSFGADIGAVTPPRRSAESSPGKRPDASSSSGLRGRSSAAASSPAARRDGGQQRAAADKKSAMPSQTRKVFVGGIPQDMRQDDLYTIFGEFAHVRKAWLQRYRLNGSPNPCPPHNHRGFGFVVFSESDAVDRLLGQHPSRFVVLRDGRRLEVKRAVSSSDMRSGASPADAPPISLHTGKVSLEIASEASSSRQPQQLPQQAQQSQQSQVMQNPAMTQLQMQQLQQLLPALQTQMQAAQMQTFQQMTNALQQMMSPQMTQQQQQASSPWPTFGGAGAAAAMPTPQVQQQASAQPPANLQGLAMNNPAQMLQGMANPNVQVQAMAFQALQAAMASGAAAVNQVQQQQQQQMPVMPNPLLMGGVPGYGVMPAMMQPQQQQQLLQQQQPMQQLPQQQLQQPLQQP